MRGLLRYLIKNYAFLLFIFLEVVSLLFVFNFNKYQRVQYLNSSNQITASVYNSFHSVVEYFSLTKVNQSLAEENARLKSFNKLSSEILSDSISTKFIEKNLDIDIFRHL